MRGFRRRRRLWRDKQPWSLAARWCRAVRSLRNLGNLRNLPLTALQSSVCLRSRVTLTAFGISRTSASASSSARLRVQSFVLSLNSLSSLNSLLFVMPSHTHTALPWYQAGWTSRCLFLLSDFAGQKTKVTQEFFENDEGVPPSPKAMAGQGRGRRSTRLFICCCIGAPCCLFPLSDFAGQKTKVI